MPDVSLIRSLLLAWYDDHARSLAWRAPPGQATRPDPYRVWLSEVMLQQTTTVHATPYYLSFTTRWPTVSDLAAAPDADVMAAWAGLGYYARARNLLACARAVAKDHSGVFPGTEAELLSLPGVGAYTAAAVAAIAFDQPANVVDGNVERVMARLHALETPLPKARPLLRALAQPFVTADRPGDWAQALMDLGAVICRPRSPLCGQCPISSQCLALKTGQAELYPFKIKKAEHPKRSGLAFVMFDQDGRVALERRPDRGLLGGMLGLPTNDWSTEAAGQSGGSAPLKADWRESGSVVHVFTHFSLTLQVRSARVERHGDYQWMPIDEARKALPTVFAKALDRAAEPALV